jgi:mRNA interferase MazF
MNESSAGRPLGRGQIYWVDWEPARGTEQRGRRPKLVAQADPINASRAYGNTIVVALTTAAHGVPTHVPLEPTGETGLSQPSYAMCEQLMAIARDRLDAYIGSVDAATMGRLDRALKRALALT